MRIFVKSATAVITALLLAACGGGGGSSESSPAPKASISNNCARQTYSYISPYGASPNNWGIPVGTTGYSNCISITDIGNDTISASFVWNFGTLVGDPVLAYPSIIYGATPGQPVSNTNLPKAINQVKSLIVNWNYSLTHGAGSDSGNVLIDSWVTTTSNHLDQTPNGYLASEGIVVELMIFLDNWGSNWATYYLKWPIVTVNGQKYYFYGGLEHGGIYAASFFPVSKPGPIGSLDLAPFYAYLTQIT